MKKLKMIGGNHSIEFGIEHIKFLLTKDIETFYATIQCIKCAISKEESEYRVEHQLQSNICINDLKVSLKSIKVWEVSPTYSMRDDQKLQTNSLMQQYIVSKLESSTFQDTVYTIDILLQSLIEELNDDEVQIDHLSIQAKHILKFMQVYAKQEETRKDEFDFTYEDLMLFQIACIQSIQKQLIAYPIMLIIAPEITAKIIEVLRQCKDCLVLVVTNTYVSSMQLEEIYLIEQKGMDLACMEDIYLLIEEQYHKRYTMEELINMIKLYLYNMYTKEQKSLINSLNTYASMIL